VPPPVVAPFAIGTASGFGMPLSFPSTPGAGTFSAVFNEAS
jgi:hypothetical protein